MHNFPKKIAIIVSLTAFGYVHDVFAHCSSSSATAKSSDTDVGLSADSKQYCNEETHIVGKRISPKLSPDAKKLILKGHTEKVDALVQVVGHADDAELLKRIGKAGITVRSWNSETNLLAIETPASCLTMLADFDEVVYIEISSPYRR